MIIGKKRRRLTVCTALVLISLRGRAYSAFNETFETGSKTSYTAGDVVCAEGSWHLDNVLLGNHVNDNTNGTKSARGYGTLAMNFDKTNGVGGVSLYHGMFGKDSNSGVSWVLSASRDGGTNWTAYVSPEQMPTADWQQATLAEINVAGPVRVKIVVTGGTTSKRVNFDDIAISDYLAPWFSARPAALAPFSTRVGTPSTPQMFTVSGETLANDALVTPPNGFEISRHCTSNYAATLSLAPASGTLAPTTAYLRMTGVAVGTYCGNVTVSSVGATAANVAVSGTVVENLMPEINGLPARINATVNAPLRIEMLATDPDGSVTQLCASSATIPDANAKLSVQAEGSGYRGIWAWTPDQPGSNTVSFTATDNEGAAVERSVAIFVEPEWLIAMRPGQTVREPFDNLAGGLTATALLPVGYKVEKNTTVRSIGTFGLAGTETERRGGNSLASGAANGIYNFGAGEAATATDRAIGFLSSDSATKSGNLMVRLVNRSPAPIPGFHLAFDVEKYREGNNAKGFAVQVYASTNGVNWTDAGASLRLFFPADDCTAGYADAPGMTAAVAGELAVAQLQPGQSLYLAWNYSVAEGSTTSSAQALAIDNIVIKAHAPKQTILIVH